MWVQVVEQQVQGEAVPELAEARLTESGLAHPNIILTHKILSRTRTVSHAYMHALTFTAALLTRVSIPAFPGSRLGTLSHMLTI